MALFSHFDAGQNIPTNGGQTNERTNGLKFKFPFSRLTIETSLFKLKLHLKVLDKSWAQMSSNRRNENAVPLDPQKIVCECR